MTERFVSATLDLSRLPPPEVVKVVDFETILAERLARLKVLWPDLDTTSLETEPAVILQQEDAYREVLTRIAINDAAKSTMVAFATGGDLDNLAAWYGVSRHVLTPANPDTGAAAVMESDGDLRQRAQLAPEALPYAGMTGGGYRSLARKVAPSLKDVTTIKRPGGRVDVVLLSRTGDGAVGSDVVGAVYTALQDDEATQLTDVVAVRSATITPYTVSIHLRLPLGPDASVVRAAAKAAVEAYVLSRHAAGRKVFRDGLIAAAKVGGVEDMDVLLPAADLSPEPDEAAYCTLVTITSEVVE